MSHREEAPRQQLTAPDSSETPRTLDLDDLIRLMRQVTTRADICDHDLRGAPITHYDVLWTGAYRDCLIRLINAVHQESLSQCREAQRWIPVSERLPDDEPLRGIPYMEFSAGPFAVIHRDRPDYPITAHAIFSDNPSAMGVAIPTNGTSRFKYVCWYSAGRDPCNPFDMATGSRGPFKDSAGYARTMPNYLGFGITHWQPLPSAPKE
jgi:hypothetical protein